MARGAAWSSVSFPASLGNEDAFVGNGAPTGTLAGRLVSVHLCRPWRKVLQWWAEAGKVERGKWSGEKQKLGKQKAEMGKGPQPIARSSPAETCLPPSLRLDEGELLFGLTKHGTTLPNPGGGGKRRILPIFAEGRAVVGAP